MNKRALIIIDLQVGLETEHKKLFQLNRVLEGVNKRIKFFRKHQLPIIFIQHEDEELVLNSANWQLFPNLKAEKQDHHIRKTHANSFFHTKLASLLEELSVDELEICGAQSEYCVDTTIRIAHGLGYQCFMEKGLTTTTDNEWLTAEKIIQHHEAIWDQRFLTFYED